MARRKFRSAPRHEPITERSYQEYNLSTPAPLTSRDELIRLIRGGEDTFLELKVRLSNPEKITQEIVALANTGGGTIVFGVNDQLRIEGVGDPEDVRDELVRLCREQVAPPLTPFIEIVAFDSGRRVVALDVEGRRRPYRTRDGRYFIRLGAEKREASREELSALVDEARPLGMENMPAIGATLADIDEAHLWSFARHFSGDAFDAPRTQDYSNAELLERDLALAVSANGERDSAATPTLAGLLLFGENSRVAALVPRSVVVCTRYAGENAQSPAIESLRLEGNLHALYEAALRFLRRYVDLWDARPRSFPGRAADESAAVNNSDGRENITSDDRFIRRANYQRAAVTESIANALTHRDLAIRESSTRIHIFDSSIEIINARRAAGFAPQLLRAIRYGMTQQLNPQIHAYFNSPAYGLELARGGLPMILHESRLFSNRRPDIHVVNDEFRLRLYGVA